jgi:hypothetical protein
MLIPMESLQGLNEQQEPRLRCCAGRNMNAAGSRLSGTAGMPSLSKVTRWSPGRRLPTGIGDVATCLHAGTHTHINVFTCTREVCAALVEGLAGPQNGVPLSVRGCACLIIKSLDLSRRRP